MSVLDDVLAEVDGMLEAAVVLTLFPRTGEVWCGVPHVARGSGSLLVVGVDT